MPHKTHFQLCVASFIHHNKCLHPVLRRGLMIQNKLTVVRLVQFIFTPVTIQSPLGPLPSPWRRRAGKQRRFDAQPRSHLLMAWKGVNVFFQLINHFNQNRGAVAEQGRWKAREKKAQTGRGRKREREQQKRRERQKEAAEEKGNNTEMQYPWRQRRSLSLVCSLGRESDQKMSKMRIVLINLELC